MRLGSLQFGMKTLPQRILHKTVDTFDVVNLFILIVRKLDFEFTYRFWGTLNSKNFILENVRMSISPSSLNVFWTNFQQICIIGKNMDARKYLAKVWKSTLTLVTKNQKRVFSTKNVYKDFFKFLYKIVMGSCTIIIETVLHKCAFSIFFYETIYK